MESRGFPKKHTDLGCALALAGTGPQILVYHLSTSALLVRERVFDGVRVHGVAHTESGGKETLLAAYGEGRVKVVRLLLSTARPGRRPKGEPASPSGLLYPTVSLPRRAHWVMHATFLAAHDKAGVAHGKAGAGSAQSQGAGRPVGASHGACPGVPKGGAAPEPGAPAAQRAAPPLAPQVQAEAGRAKRPAPAMRLAVGLGNNCVEVWAVAQTTPGTPGGAGGWTASLEASFRTSGKEGCFPVCPLPTGLGCPPSPIVILSRSLPC